jgi:2-polyprenyl-3-methyl-5-hydroxy-6-metoxy-1,4-benzoquinol methylase
MSSLTKTQISRALNVIIAEDIVGIVPKGTHEFDKFIDLADLQSLCFLNGLQLLHS